MPGSRRCCADAKRRVSSALPNPPLYCSRVLQPHACPTTAPPPQRTCGEMPCRYNAANCRRNEKSLRGCRDEQPGQRAARRRHDDQPRLRRVGVDATAWTAAISRAPKRRQGDLPGLQPGQPVRRRDERDGRRVAKSAAFGSAVIRNGLAQATRHRAADPALIARGATRTGCREPRFSSRAARLRADECRTRQPARGAGPVTGDVRGRATLKRTASFHRSRRGPRPLRP